MTIKQFQYINEIVKCGSFSAAANNLFISQSNLSLVVKDLEEELGIVIFNRSNKGVSLTADGKELYGYTLKILEQVNVIENRYKNNISGKALSVYTQHYDFAADVFADFVNKHFEDGFNFVFKETKTTEIIKNVKYNNCDIGVIIIKDNDYALKRFLKANHISVMKIGSASPHVFLRNGHPMSNRKEIPISSMSQFPFIVYGQGDYGGGLFKEELTEQIASKKSIEIYDRATLMNLLISTDSFTVGTGIMASKLNNGNIVSIPLLTDENYFISVLTAENTVLSVEAMEFLNMLKELFNNLSTKNSEEVL